MSQTHDLALGRPGAHLEAVGQRRPLDEQRVVPRRLERDAQPAEDSLAVVEDGRGLSVHQPTGPHHLAAERLADGLVAEAHAEDGRLAAEAPDEIERNSSLVRGAGTGRDEDPVGPPRSRTPSTSIASCSVDLDARPETRTQVLDQVEGERVVIVDDDDQGAHWGRGEGGGQ